MTDLDKLRYPIGRFERLQAALEPSARAAMIVAIDQAPETLRGLVTGLSDAHLDTPYRPGGWTIRQVIHHVPDSHLNAYVRMKLAVTEETPPIRTYEEGRWAELPEAKTAPVAMSLELLAALHRRWVAFLRALPESDFRKAYVHPEMGRVTLDEALAMYAWHGRHHAAHIRRTLDGLER
jgi:hypothetical protein